MSEFIDLTEGSGMTRNFRKDKENILDAQYQNLDILPICETFDAAQVISMLGNNGCVSLRIYYGMDSEMKVHAILVGADIDGNDMLPPVGKIENFILERGERCPFKCPPTSPLNS